MAIIQREYDFDSILLNEKFLKNIFKILDKINPKNVGLRTEITVNSESERSIFQDLKDFLESRLLPSHINSISIKRWPYNKKDKDKVIQFQFNINPDNPYYKLVGYDHGKLSTCEKELAHLFNQYKNWYSFLFKLPSDLNSSIPFLVVLSFSILVYSFFPAIQPIQNYKGWISFGIFVITFYFFKKTYNFLFPFIDYQINQTNRSNWWRALIGIISTGLLINLMWNIIILVFFSPTP